jgi:hypothetical protein
VLVGGLSAVKAGAVGVGVVMLNVSEVALVKPLDDPSNV